MLTGRAPSEFEHAVVTGLTMRLYLLERETLGGKETLAIEIDDLHGGQRLDEYSGVVNKLAFAPSK